MQIFEKLTKVSEEILKGAVNWVGMNRNSCFKGVRLIMAKLIMAKSLVAESFVAKGYMASKSVAESFVAHFVAYLTNYE